jgi:hypothetical protein
MYYSMASIACTTYSVVFVDQWHDSSSIVTDRHHRAYRASISQREQQRPHNWMVRPTLVGEAIPHTQDRHREGSRSHYLPTASCGKDHNHSKCWIETWKWWGLFRNGCDDPEARWCSGLSFWYQSTHMGGWRVLIVLLTRPLASLDVGLISRCAYWWFGSRQKPWRPCCYCAFFLIG